MAPGSSYLLSKTQPATVLLHSQIWRTTTNPKIMTRRSKRKSLVAIRCSARQQARQQQDAEIYGSDYGILPSGACFRVWRVCVLCGCVFGFSSCLACCHISLLTCYMSLLVVVGLNNGRLIHGESLRHSRAVRNVVSCRATLSFGSNLEVASYSLTTLLTLLFTIQYYYATMLLTITITILLCY